MPDHNVDDELSPEEEIEKFIYAISHELRSPLTAVLGMTQILQEDYSEELGQEGKYYLERINVNAKKMEIFFNDLLKFSRVGRLYFPKEKIKVNYLIQDIVKNLSNDKNLRQFDIEYHCELPIVTYDRQALRDIFYNLIENAIIFTPIQRKPKIIVSYTYEQDEHIFSIMDNGIGIDDENTKKIFKLFERLKDIDVIGNGIGLSLIKKIVEYYGGRVWLKSSKGEGSMFYFTVPNMEENTNEI